VWEDGVISVRELVRGRYKRRSHSVAFPDLDLVLICRLLMLPATSKAIAEMKKALTR